MRHKLYLLLPILVFSFALTSFAGKVPKAELQYPKGGATFTPGQTVNIRWNVKDADSALFCEQEIYLVVDKISYRISPELRNHIRSYQWVVPNIPTNKAMLQLNLGCTRGSTFEASYLQEAHVFQIRQ